MDIDPATPIPGPSSSSDLTEPPSSVQQGLAILSNGSAKPRRLLRARPSESSPLTTASPGSKRGRSDTSTQLRQATEKELEYIKSKLSEESILANRDGVIKGKEAELRGVVDGHDDAVREKFHLERYISIFEGWNPRDAKQDNSPVFLEYKRANYNLMELLPSIPVSKQAGPSRPRASIGSRTTRRRATEQADIFTAEPAPSPMKPQPEPLVTGKGKGKACQSDVELELKSEVEELVPVSKKRGRPPKQDPSASNDMPPPPVPTKAKGKGKGRRATMGMVAGDEIVVESMDEEVEPDPGGGHKGKKRGRPSLPNLPLKKGRNALLEDEAASPSPAVETPDEVEAAPTPVAAPALPSLAHLPFPDPPLRPRQRPRGTRKMYYTDPIQLPPTNTRYQGDINAILESYIHIEDTGPPADLKALELRAAREAYFRNRVNYLQHQGRLLRLLDTDATSAAKISTKPPPLPPRKTDYQDSLMSHMVQVRTAMINEAKSKPLVCKKIARMIQAYWDHIHGKDDRERLAEEKRRKAQMKELTKALRKRWALAVKVIRAKLVQLQKEEQDRLGKEHLQNMLQRSTGLLDAHRDEFAGREDGDSSGTDDVSSAEDSGEDESDEGEDGDDEDGDEDDEDNEEDEAADQQDTGAENHQDLQIQERDAEVDVTLRDPPNAVFDQDNSLTDRQDALASSQHSGEDRPDGEAGEEESEDDEADESDGSDSDLDVDTRALLADDEEDTAANEPVVEAIAGEPTGQPADSSENVILPNGGLEPTSSRVNERSAATEPRIPVDPLITNGHRVDSSIPHPHAEVTLGSGLDSIALPVGDQISATTQDPQNLPIRSPSRRRRARNSYIGTATPETDDPDAGDIEFRVETTSDVDEKDHELDVEMEDEGGDQDSPDEDNGLLADAELPIEELLKRYGYDVPVSNSFGKSNGDGDKKATAKAEVGEAKIEIDKADQSLTDAALPDVPASPVLMVEGKRQRRARAVWTPEDNPPPPPKKPKVQIVLPEGAAVVPEPDEEIESEGSTPKFTSSEDEDDEEEEDDEEAEEGEDHDKEDGDKEADPNRLRAPFLLRGSLRPYQHAGLEWLASLYTNNMNGILADEMGLGKTIQTIALLAHLACDKGIWGQHLIIVPTSVILNWEMEFKKFLPGMKVLTYYGNQKERKEKRVGWHTQHHFQVCITSYQIVLADQHIFRRKSWVYMILDEAHNIKNFRSQRWQTLLGFKAQRRLLLTGTPLQNNLMELWSLLYFLMPGGVAEDATAVVGFANHKEFTEWFSNPMDKAVESGEVIDEEMLETVNKLHTLLRPFILRRLKSEVETQLPGKFEHVVYCKLSKRQRFLYDEFMARASTKEALSSGGYLGVVNTLMQLRKVCNHPDLFEVRPVRTSFAMDPVVSDYEPVELLVRKRLLAIQDDRISLVGLNLNITANEDMSAWACETRKTLDASDRLPYAIEPITTTKKGKQAPHPPLDTLTVEGWLKYRAWYEEQKSIARWRNLRDSNRRRCAARPIFGSTMLSMLTDLPNVLQPLNVPSTRPHMFGEHAPPASSLVASLAERSRVLGPVVNYYAVIPPNAVARGLATYALPGLTPLSHPSLTDPEFDTLHQSTVKLQIAFPDSSLLQYDCGKLQTLYTMLRDLKAGGHRVLIFTQMTRVLDILEMFLSYNGHRYLRLDGSTKIEDRQIITERFNSDSRIFCFIASSRSGGVGINLTGADTVFFYDSDWNPSMDRQCMDRAHRIGQTREVHIYRFVSTHTVEENMLKKANQKRMLDKVVIQEGEFTTDFFGKMDWRDVIEPVSITEGEAARNDSDAPNGDDTVDAAGSGAKIEDIEIDDEPTAINTDTLRPRVGEDRELARALAEVEDEEDAAAARIAQGEGELDFNEFSGVEGQGQGQAKKPAPLAKRVGFDRSLENSGTPATPVESGEQGDEGGEDGEEEGDDEEDDGIGSVDEYMLKLVEWDWAFFSTYRA